MNFKIAVVICNWNKKYWLTQCIQSLLKSSLGSFELIVVDNASTDGSVGAIMEQFGNKVNIIVNKENKGGSGGFNTGIRIALEKGYKYIHLLDNDVIVDPKAIEELFYFMEENPDVAAAGSKIYSFDQPNHLQELGASINWNEFNIRPNYKGYIDDETIPELIECDYVPACSVMVQAEVIKKVGLMDESFFIYWDDIEWFYRMKLAGYRIVANSRSKVWHKMGASNHYNTFATYYFWRNRIHFFTRYCNELTIMKFSEKIFDDLFQAVFFSNYKKQYNVSKTLLIALQDALDLKVGKALEERIFDREQSDNRFQDIIKQHQQISLIDCGDFNIMKKLTNYILHVNPNIYITILSKNKYIVQQFRNINIDSIDLIENYRGQPIFQVCNHIKDVINTSKIDIYKLYYVDQYMNVLLNKEDMEQIKKYEQTYKTARKIFLPVVKNKIKDLKTRLVR
ncbi:glycosyltransferase family 2 protein [Bacillus smithii]|uniref:glycosyltransferase family 2 protein n=1 Tax=Bacillus smithii TaxID=1479 RepID=UPI002E22B8AE|nr:glycosyltransferase family 2 protein [Bacillus smithii]MED1456798.1 glycosyltransferase family 2 protein [Bacillus smithii]